MLVVGVLLAQVSVMAGGHDGLGDVATEALKELLIFTCLNHVLLPSVRSHTKVLIVVSKIHHIWLISGIIYVRKHLLTTF